MGPNRVMSLPDAVAGALLENYFPAEKVEQLNMFNSVFGLDAPPPTQESVPASNGTAVQGYLSGADICPSCGVISLIRQDGCRKCTSCGYSEC
jgi:ribonucleoside-diphosphate reductase alpha chain